MAIMLYIPYSLVHTHTLFCLLFEVINSITPLTPLQWKSMLSAAGVLLILSTYSNEQVKLREYPTFLRIICCETLSLPGQGRYH